MPISEKLTTAALLLFTLTPAFSQTYDQKVQQALTRIDGVIAKGPYQASWASLEKYTPPNWYADSKFGIFIHWGVYSVPAFGSEWYPRMMYQPEEEKGEIYNHHVATYGRQSKFGYKDFIPKFKAEKYNPGAWATLFKNSGARFVMPVAEHHDGFPMYDCSFTEWSAAKMGPKRDVVGDLSKAVRKQGLHFAASSHRAEHWWFYDGGMTFDSDVKDPKNAGLYAPAKPRKTPDGKESTPDKKFLDDWLVRTCELVDKYQPEVVWFDWWIEQPAFQPYLQKFAAYYYNRGAEWGKGVAINYKFKSFPDKAAVLDIERGKLDKAREFLWQTDTSISLKSWGYIENDNFRTADSLVDDLVDIVSKNGVLLLNVGPKSDGTIPDQEQKILLDMGKWLSVNGEAIYGTRPWQVFGEGPTEVLAGGFTDKKQKPFTGQDIRFTSKGDTIYAIALDDPGQQMRIKSLGTGDKKLTKKIASITMLGSNEKLTFTQDADALSVEMPKNKPTEYAYVLKIAPER
jgi:alpha-L-fucosidase